jgi:hypothetical protein
MSIAMPGAGEDFSPGGKCLRFNEVDAYGLIQDGFVMGRYDFWVKRERYIGSGYPAKKAIRGAMEIHTEGRGVTFD